MKTLLVIALLLIGALFMLLAAVGVVRLPDLYLRMQAATKSATLGIAALALAAAVQHGDAATWFAAALLIAFFFLTAPVAAHVIGRSAYLSGVPLWRETRLDELAGAVPAGAGHGQPEPALSEDPPPLCGGTASQPQSSQPQSSQPQSPQPQSSHRGEEP